MNLQIERKIYSYANLSALVCNFRTFVGHFIPSIWLKFGMKSLFMILITKWILKSSSYFCLPKKRESALGLPILARQYGRSKVIFFNSARVLS